MNRLILLLIACVALIGGLFFLFQEDFKSTTSSSNSSNILFTDVEVNLNCPMDVTVINNLIEIYSNNSCPRITIRRLDLKSKSQVTIQPQISWLNNFRASLFPLTKDDLQADMELFRAEAITEELTLLLNTPRSIDAKCDYSNVLANYTFKDIHMPYNNLTCYVNRAVAEGKNKVVFKVLSCPKVVVPPPPPPKDRDRDGFVDARDKCPDNAGKFEGCPDTDGDGGPDHKDDCIEVPGKNKGCPPIARVEMNLDSDGKTLYFKGGKIGSENYKIQFEDSKSGKKRRSSKHSLPVGQSILTISKALLGQLVSTPKIANSDYQPKKSNTRLQPFTVIVFDSKGRVSLSQEIWLDCGALNKN